MSDPRIGSKPLTAPAAARPKASAAPADSLATAPAVKLGADSLALSQKAPAAEAAKKTDEAADALALLKTATTLPSMPKDPAEQKAWLMAGFASLLKAEAAKGVIRQATFDHRLKGDAYFNAQDRIAGLEKRLKASPQYESVRKEFFDGLIAPAQQLMDSLASYPAPPADKAGKAAWLAEAKQKSAEAHAAQKLLKDIWFEHQALDFKAMTDSDRKLWDFDGRLARVDRELNPPPAQPKPAAGAPKKGQADEKLDAFRPLMGATQSTSDMMKQSKAGEAVGSVVMPIALMVDMIDLITRPAQIAEQMSSKKGK